jgi:hypothetical protein
MRDLRPSPRLKVRWFDIDVSGLPIGPIFKGHCTRPLKMRCTRSPETSVQNHRMPRNNPQDGRIHAGHNIKCSIISVLGWILVKSETICKQCEILNVCMSRGRHLGRHELDWNVLCEMEEISTLQTPKGYTITRTEVGGSDSKETRFIPEITDPVHVMQVDNRLCSPSYTWPYRSCCFLFLFFFSFSFSRIVESSKMYMRDSCLDSARQPSSLRLQIVAFVSWHRVDL